MLNIRNYKLLNTAKFNVINSIEEKLPSAPFKDEWQFLDILALGNCGSGKMETGVPDTETILIGLIVSSHGTRNCQAQSRFAVCKQA